MCSNTPAARDWRPTRRDTLLLATLLLLHCGLLLWGMLGNSPTVDEAAHLPAGLAVWRFGRTDLYRVNPPLPRTLAALPLLVLEHREDWSRYQPHSPARSEWRVGADFIAANGPAAPALFTWARLPGLVFACLGIWVSWRWGGELAGPRGAGTAAALWAFSPFLLGHGALITPDVPATATGLWAGWRCDRWLRRCTLQNSLAAGLTLGLAVLCRSSWVILFALWPFAAVMRAALADPTENPPTHRARLALQQLLVLAVGWNVLCLGYGYRGVGQPLGELTFFSSTLAGKSQDPEVDPGGNSLGALLARTPNPLPRDFLLGLDLQRRDFERPVWNYLAGEIRSPGWLYYYALGLLWKTPLPVWGLALWGAGCLWRRRAETGWDSVTSSTLVLPAAVVFVLASLQVQQNHHVRYVMSAVPVLHLLGSIGVAQAPRLVGLAAILATTLGAAFVAPYWLSDVNWLAGGPQSNWRVLSHSNVDWGQDLLRARDWLERNPDRRPVTLAAVRGYPLQAIGIDLAQTPSGKPVPGWHLISVHRLVSPDSGYEEYRKMNPVDRVGYSLNIYYVPDASPDRP